MKLYYDGEIKLEKEWAVLMDFCDYVTDLFEDMFIYTNKNQITKIDLDKTKCPDIDKVGCENDLHDLLYNNGVLYDYYKKKCFSRLLLDFVIYLRQSVDNIIDFNPQVALTLARKPLIDDLYYLEKLRYDPIETIDYIMLNEHKANITKVEIKDIYNKLNIKYPNRYANVFDLRIGNSIPNLKNMCDKSSHIITENKVIKSEKGELNFVFMEADEIANITKDYLTIVVQILIYAFTLITDIFYDFFEIDEETKKFNEQIFIMNCVNVIICSRLVNKKPLKKISDLLDIKDNKLFCNKCKQNTNFIVSRNKNYKRYYQCLNCKTKTFIKSYYNKGETNG